MSRNAPRLHTTHDVAVPRGQPCASCGAPVERDDQYCPSCGTHVVTTRTLSRSVGEADAAWRSFFCKNCGAQLFTETDQRSDVCPFCDSTYVRALDPSRRGRQQPEFVIGFAITPQEAANRFRDWIAQNAWFRPGDLSLKALLEKQKGVYLPFWHFSMLAQSRWTASIGEHWYRTERYTTTDSRGKRVTRTRRIRETEWWPLVGKFHRYHSGFLVSGSHGLPQAEADRIQPFELPALKRYQPYFLAGWMCEEYSVSREDALTTCREEFSRRQREQVHQFLPGDTQREVNIQTEFEQIHSDLCLLPIYVLSYRYQQNVYRFLVNGQTGRIAGDKPVSYRRITMAIVSAILFAAAVAGTVIILQQW